MTPSHDDLLLTVFFWLLLPCLAVLVIAAGIELYRAALGRLYRWRVRRELHILMTERRRQQFETKGDRESV